MLRAVRMLLVAPLILMGARLFAENVTVHCKCF